MRKLKLVLLAAVAASMAIVMPSAAAHATPKEPFYRTFTGYTYPDNPGGLAACNAYGAYLEETYGYNNYECILNEPDAGLYGLYEYYIFPAH